MVCILAKLAILEGRQEEFEQVFASLADAVRQNEEGNLFYQLCRDREDTTRYVVMEAYRDEAAVEAHRKSEHFRSVGKKLGDYLASPPDIRTMDGIG